MLKWIYKIYSIWEDWKIGNLLQTIDNTIQWTAYKYLQSLDWRSVNVEGIGLSSNQESNSHWILENTKLFLGSDSSTSDKWDCNDINTTSYNACWVVKTAVVSNIGVYSKDWDSTNLIATNTYYIPPANAGTYYELGIACQHSYKLTYYQPWWYWISTYGYCWVSRASATFNIPTWWAYITYQIQVEPTHDYFILQKSTTEDIYSMYWLFYGTLRIRLWDTYPILTTYRFPYISLWDWTNVLDETDDSLWNELYTVPYTAYHSYNHLTNWAKIITAYYANATFTNLPVDNYTELGLGNWTKVFMRQLATNPITNANNTTLVSLRLLFI